MIKKDCEFCSNFKWDKEKGSFGNKIFDIPFCKAHNKTVNSPNEAEKCSDFKDSKGRRN